MPQLAKIGILCDEKFSLAFTDIRLLWAARMIELLLQAHFLLDPDSSCTDSTAPDEGVALALLRTLLPWVNVGRDPGAEGSGEGEGDAAPQPDEDEGHAARD